MRRLDKVKTIGLVLALVAALSSAALRREANGLAPTQSVTTPPAGVVERLVSNGTVAARPGENGAKSRPLKLPLASPKIVVEKAARRLTLYSGGEAVRVYPVGLGTSPVGDKERQGDRRTPEGDFHVCIKNPRSAFYLSLGLSYPNEEDAERALRERQITRAEHRRIVNAVKRKRTPPWDTALGGEIFIHGNGARSDWTWGCIALEDADIKELFDAVPVGTPVRIEP